MTQPSSYRDLYYAWERDQWSAGDIDLDEDHRRWALLKPELRSRVERVVAVSSLIAERSTQLLVPLVDAAPTEEQQVFLTTQLVDSARHAVFFGLVAQKFRNPDAATAIPEDPVDPTMREMVDGALVASMSKLHAAPEDRDLFASAAKLYYLKVEAQVVREQTGLLNALEEAQALPAVRAGLVHVLRDGARHLEFARRYLAGSGGGATTAR